MVPRCFFCLADTFGQRLLQLGDFIFEIIRLPNPANQAVDVFVCETMCGSDTTFWVNKIEDLAFGITDVPLQIGFSAAEFFSQFRVSLVTKNLVSQLDRFDGSFQLPVSPENRASSFVYSGVEIFRIFCHIILPAELHGVEHSIPTTPVVRIDTRDELDIRSGGHTTFFLHIADIQTIQKFPQAPHPVFRLWNMGYVSIPYFRFSQRVDETCPYGGNNGKGAGWKFGI